MKHNIFLALALIWLVAQVHLPAAPAQEDLVKDPATIRFATFNISFNRRSEGALKEELAKGNRLNPKRIAEIIQRVRPDVLLINEFDYDPAGEGIAHFLKNYLGVSQNGQDPIAFPYVYFDAVNTGVDSGLDLDNDGKQGTANDAFGYGSFPGQYGMVVLSQLEIDKANVRTFRKFLWKDMPGFLWPMLPNSETPYYSDKAKEVFRLSSKSHWDIPIKINDKTIHLLAAHPTPPVFDKEEDRNGRRNHDEIRLFADYVTPGKSNYIYDDLGQRGGLTSSAYFVIAGDMNADEADGDSSGGAAKQLTEHPLLNHSLTPQSEGGPVYAKEQGGVNGKHKGNPAFDTADFSDAQSGNLRVDYCLPSKTLVIRKSGVFWPKPDQPGAGLVKATDHRMVWIDIEK